MLVRPGMLTLVPSRESPPAEGRAAMGLPSLPALGFAALIAAAVLGAIVSAGSDRREIERLDPATRAGLVERTVADLRSACNRNKGATAPSGWCRDQAEFVLHFDECRAGCRATAREVLRVSPR